LERFLFAQQRFFRRVAMNILFGLRGRILAAEMLIGCVVGGVVAGPVAAQTAPQQTIAQKIAASKDLLDINTATAAQLKALPGMGDAYVQRVVAGRPYTAKNQLTTRGILPATAYEQIKVLIVAHRAKP
jgi:DNA uptake protein ComE-like DNA-binding protein